MGLLSCLEIINLTCMGVSRPIQGLFGGMSSKEWSIYETRFKGRHSTILGPGLFGLQLWAIFWNCVFLKSSSEHRELNGSENISLPPRLVKFPTLCNHGYCSVYKHRWRAYVSLYVQKTVWGVSRKIAMGYSRATAGAAIQEFKYNSNTRIFPLVFEGTSAHTYTVTSMCLFKKLQTSVLVSGNVFTTDRPYFVLIKIWQNTV